MKNQTGIWIDGSVARIITFYDGKETIREIFSEIEMQRHNDNEKGNADIRGKILHPNRKARSGHNKRSGDFHFLDEVIDEVRDTDEIFIMGSSGAKKKLQSRMQADKHLQPKLKGLLTTDHLTLNQCVAKVKEFYNL